LELTGTALIQSGRWAGRHHERDPGEARGGHRCLPGRSRPGAAPVGGRRASWGRGSDRLDPARPPCAWPGAVDGQRRPHLDRALPLRRPDRSGGPRGC